MKHTINTEITINAPILEVWNTFRDFSTHSQWNTFLKIHDENILVGHPLLVDFLSDGKVKMSMKPTLLKDEANKSFEWQGHLFIKGLFDGHHQFHLEAIDDMTTSFVQKENFSGILIRILKKSVLDPTEQDFIKMNENLKAYIENKS